MQILSNVNFNFMKWKTHLVIASTVLNLFGIVLFAWQSMSGTLHVGIDFKGGTELQVKFANPVAVGDVRSALDRVDLKGATVTTMGDVKANEIYIRLPLQAVESQVLIGKATEALRGLTAQTSPPPGTIDLNVADEKTTSDYLVDAGKFSADEAKSASAAISAFKKGRGGIIMSVEEVRSLPGVKTEIGSWLSGKAILSAFSIRSQNSVEGAISKELAQKAFYAVIGSMIVMLIYIGVRFKFHYGLGAIVALIHDVIVTLGIFCLVGKEWSLPVVASFLTLTGYSVNDTIVVFDRIRENLKKKHSGTLEDVINASINQTLSRTIITSFLTWLVVLALYLFGGEVINGFAFVLLVGIIVGTYSSIYIASPIVIFWERMFTKKAGAPGPARARA